MILHEVTEAYEGAKISMEQGISSPAAIKGVDNGSVYDRAHAAASPQHRIEYEYLDVAGNPAPYSLSPKTIIYYVMVRDNPGTFPPSLKPKEFYRIVR